MLNMKIGVLGSGGVGETLADGFLKYGCTVMRGSRAPEKLEEWRGKAGPKASIGTFEKTATFGELLVLAVKGTAALSITANCGAALDGKVILDTTNPISETPPVDGILEYFTGPNDSLIERLQAQHPKARFVKCFSSVGNANMVDPRFGDVQPTMFICGNDKSAKEVARKVLDAFGWETEDLGTARGGRAIEPLCITWCAPGFLEGRWTHAFKVLKR